MLQIPYCQNNGQQLVYQITCNNKQKYSNNQSIEQQSTTPTAIAKQRTCAWC